MKKLIFFILLPVTFFGCNRSVIFSELREIPNWGWNKDSVFSFDVKITDTISTYEICFVLRNTDEFPRQNLWLSTSRINDDKVVIDTTEIYLADDYGKWRGRGIGSYFDNEIIYKQHIKFCKSDKYTYQLRHIMRSDYIVGLKYVGLKIIKEKN
jgi:gliding motility-associated lipoprotein GldH